MSLDYGKIKEAAREAMRRTWTRFLREIVKNPGRAAGEKAHIDRIAEEMRRLEFDK